MKEIFKSEKPWGKKEPQALVIHCSAHDFGSHFREFIEKHLKLEEYDLLAVPGSIQILTLANYLPKFEALGRKWIKFLVKNHHLPKIIIIGHDDCSWYKDFRFGPIHFDLKKRQLEDLKNVAQMLRSELGVAVEVYFAGHENNGPVTFSHLE